MPLNIDLDLLQLGVALHQRAELRKEFVQPVARCSLVGHASPIQRKFDLTVAKFVDARFLDSTREVDPFSQCCFLVAQRLLTLGESVVVEQIALDAMALKRACLFVLERVRVSLFYEVVWKEIAVTDGKTQLPFLASFCECTVYDRF